MTSPGVDPSSNSPGQFQSEYSALRDELAAVANTLARLQERFAQATQIAEEEIARRTRRIEELEAENTRNEMLLARLHVRNTRLQEDARASAARGPAAMEAELRQVKEERDQALRKLRHAWKLIQDQANSMSLASSTPRSRYTTAPSSASPKSPSAQGPSRPAHGRPSSPVKTPKGFQQPRSRAARVSTVHSDDDDQAPPNDGGNASEQTVDGPTDLYESYSFKDESTGGEEGDFSYEWKFTELPAVASVICGSTSFDYLATKLQMDEDTATEIEQIAEATEVRTFRFYPWGDKIMFVFDPILLEFSTQTFMVNWMTPESAAAIRDKIWGADNPNLHKEFHTYFRLPSEDPTTMWYYAGKLQWSISQLPSQWPTYNRQNRRDLAQLLAERWCSTLTPKDVGALIKNNRFQQFAIELSNNEALDNLSRKVAKRKLELPIQTPGERSHD